MTAFLLIASPSESIDGTRIPAEAMAMRRIEAGYWGLYENTPYKKKIQPGDTLIVYLAGYGGRRFFASAEAGSIEFNPPRGFCVDGDALTDPPAAVISLVSTRIFSPSLPIIKIKEMLEFIPKGISKWGCVLQRGVKLVSDADASLILTEAASETGKG